MNHQNKKSVNQLIKTYCESSCISRTDINKEHCNSECLCPTEKISHTNSLKHPKCIEKAMPHPVKSSK